MVTKEMYKLFSNQDPKRASKIYDEAGFLVASFEVVEGKILSLFLAISNCLTRAYAALPKSTTALDVHHQKLLTSALI